MRASPEEEQEARVDDLVREVLAVRPHAAERVVEEALRSAAADTTGSAARRRAMSLRAAVAIGVGVLVVGAVLNAPGWRIGRPQVRQAPRGSLSNEGSVIILTMPGSPTTILGPDGQTSLLPAGTSSVELLGEPQ